MVSFQNRGAERARRMFALGHVWTAPWQELFSRFAALVGCGHVSSLLMRRVWQLPLMLCVDRGCRHSGNEIDLKPVISRPQFVHSKVLRSKPG